jgi:hypothetical protein
MPVLPLPVVDASSDWEPIAVLLLEVLLLNAEYPIATLKLPLTLLCIDDCPTATLKPFPVWEFRALVPMPKLYKGVLASLKSSSSVAPAVVGKAVLDPLTNNPAEVTLSLSVEPAPISTVEDIVEVPLSLPITVLLEPVVIDFPASAPNAVLFPPVVTAYRAFVPTAVISEAVVVALPAMYPTAV